MINITYKNKCCGCHACFNICPKNCISMERDEEGFLYPVVDKNQCINCGLCEKACPFLRDEPLRETEPITFAAKSNNDELRMLSSSGGIFSLLAMKVLEDNGVVYGCCMSDDNRSAFHCRVDNLEDLPKLRGSKYFQSTIGGIYKQVKTDLLFGKTVLFSGVPCQINGLKLFLQKEYDNLITVEVICHGTPSPALWEKYHDYLEEKYNAKIEKVSFRHKKNGWKTFGLTYEENKIFQYKSQHVDPFMRMFLRDYCLRPSCYACNAKKLESTADLTIADFWGIHSVAPEMDDDFGTSLVLIQSEKGKTIFNSLDLVKKEVTFKQGINCNPAYYKSCLKPLQRDTFFVDMNSMTFDELSKIYAKDIKVSFYRRLRGFAGRVIRKIFGGG